MKIFTLTQEHFLVNRFIKLIPVLTLMLTQLFAFGSVKSDSKNAKALLPIVWTPLKGYYSQGVTYLSWSSLQESNSSHFDIQRSTDGVNFYSAGKLAAQAVSDKVTSYAFSDMKAEDGMNYYRIQYFDNDGHYQYSNTILVNVLIKGVNITAIYPGPFTDRVNINVASELKTNASIQLFDNSGKAVIGRNYVIGKGVSTLCMDNLGSLSKGVYIMRIKAGESVLTKTLIK